MKETNYYTSLKIKRDVIQKMKVIAALNAESIQDWLRWVVDKAYDVEIRKTKKKS